MNFASKTMYFDWFYNFRLNEHGPMITCCTRSNQGQDKSHHDIALIRVNGRIEFSDKVTPINLPSASFDIETDGECEETFRNSPKSRTLIM